MPISKLLKSLTQYGPIACFNTFKAKAQRIYFYKKIQKFNLLESNFNISDFNKLKNNTSFNFKFFEETNYLEKGNDLLNNCFQIFEEPLCFDKTIFWDNPSDKYFEDLRAIWEMSRLQCIFYLGKSYEKTKEEKYSLKFTEILESWNKNNPFPHGKNWTCPMEVSIRAINLIWGFHFFKTSTTISLKFWEKFINLLYLHKNYLKNNWEIFLKNNNHYIADLLGYFYLCLFFKNIKPLERKINWCQKQLLKEFFKQVHPDGSSYEGSTNYHKLVTEMFLHFYSLSKIHNLEVPKAFTGRLKGMLLFLNNCSDYSGNLVQVGDNDSSKIVAGIKIKKPQPKELVQHYQNFGLSIIKTKNDINNWYITFRHPNYNPKQPTGHFHKDELSITLTLNNIPIIVDPGTYLYTGNQQLRNFLRSESSHNNFYLENLSKSSDPLFSLTKFKHTNTAKIINNNKIIISDHHNQYKSYGIQAYRKLIFDKHKNLEINDWFINKANQEPKAIWNLIFHPKINLIQKNETVWLIQHSENIIASLNSSLKFKKAEIFYSKSYGIIEKTTKLTAYMTNIGSIEKTVISKSN
ncbi:heparinase II/III family protein [Candidatus Babeliales bacterium]|nr:heparinase II/III family protein [Candidatus Babeliales bacterium]